MKRLFLSLCIAITLSTPVAPAQAQFTVTEVGPNVIQNTINAGANSLSASFQSALSIKELTLDGIAFGISRTIIQSMVSSIVNWINSGFQGSPAFVTDLEGYLGNVADQVVSDTLTGSDLAFLCSPFALDVRVAIATEYNNRSQDPFDIQCTLEDVSNNVEGFLQGSFQEGGWDAWFELTQSETNDPNAAYLSAQVDLDAAIRNAQGEAIAELDWGDGFLSFKVCSDTQAQSGAQENCTITTPGRVIADQLNNALGAGQDQLIAADEINEIIGALMAQLAQRALTGTYGLLGLGGSSDFTEYSFGSSGQSSYLDALAVEQVDTGTSSANTLSGTAFTTALTNVADNLDVQYEIVSRVDAAENDYEARSERLSNRGCTAPTWPSLLADAQTDASAAITRLEVVNGLLIELRDRYTAATSPQEQDAIMQQYLLLQQQGDLPSNVETIELEFFVQYDLRDEISELRQDLSLAENRCFDDDDD